MTLAIIVIIVIGLVLGAALAVRIVATAMSSRPAAPAAAEQPQTPQQMPQVLELRQDSGADASAPGPELPSPVLGTGPPSNQAAPPAAESQGVAKIGQTITINGLNADTRIAVTLNRIIDRATSKNPILPPATGNRYAAVEITIKNVGKTSYSDSPLLGAAIIDTEGQQHRTALADIAEGTSFSEGITIAIGDSRKGVIIFQVPESAHLAKLQFGATFAQQKGEWLLT